MKNRDTEFTLLFGSNEGYVDVDIIGTPKLGDVGFYAYSLIKKERDFAISLSTEIARKLATEYYAIERSLLQALKIERALRAKK